jgi:hypothetical protein
VRGCLCAGSPPTQRTAAVGSVPAHPKPSTGQGCLSRPPRGRAAAARLLRGLEEQDVRGAAGSALIPYGDSLGPPPLGDLVLLVHVLGSPSGSVPPFASRGPLLGQGRRGWARIVRPSPIVHYLRAGQRDLATRSPVHHVRFGAARRVLATIGSNRHHASPRSGR